MNELNRLRQESYQSAAEFHQAMGAFYTAARLIDDAQKLAIVNLARVTGEKYRVTLKALLDYLSAAMPHSDYRSEQQRTRELIEVLERELALLPT